MFDNFVLLAEKLWNCVIRAYLASLQLQNANPINSTPAETSACGVSFFNMPEDAIGVSVFVMFVWISSISCSKGCPNTGHIVGCPSKNHQKSVRSNLMWKFWPHNAFHFNSEFSSFCLTSPQVSWRSVPSLCEFERTTRFWSPGLIKWKLTVGRHEATTKSKRGIAVLHIFPCAADAESGWCLKAGWALGVMWNRFLQTDPHGWHLRLYKISMPPCQ